MTLDLLNHEETNTSSPKAAELPTYYVVVLAASLPATVLVVWMLGAFEVGRQWYIDTPGYVALLVGLGGILLFNSFYHKYLVRSSFSAFGKWMLLISHVVSILLLLVAVVWLGILSPWSNQKIWGTFDLETLCRVYIISIIVFGAISSLGSFLYMLGQREHHAPST